MEESGKHYKEIIKVLEVSTMPLILSADSAFKHLLAPTRLCGTKTKLYNSVRCFTPSSQNDKRYLVLECVAEEREMILQDFMKDLHFRGPPPPPTATNPSERLRKP